MASLRKTEPERVSPAEIRELTVLGCYGYSSIPTITQFVAEAARAAQLDEDSVFHCQMAVDEACTNVIEHAYGEENTGNIELACFIEPGRCTIRITDHGKPFDPTLVPAPKSTPNLDDIRPGGIGLHLMKQLMDEVRFEFSEQGNALTMVKSSPTPSEPPAPAGFKIWNDRNGIWVVQPEGQVDSLAAGQLDATLGGMVEKGRIQIVVDLSDVTYVSSRGLKALVSCWRQTHDLGGKFAICSVAPRVQSIIETIGFNQIFEIYPTLADALKALAAG